MTFASSSGIRIHYQDTGAGPPLVLLNGFMSSGLNWPREWIAGLAHDFRLLRICNRGTGHSEVVEQAFSLADMAADVAAVLDDAGVAKASIFGHSMGGMLAQVFAFDHPERVERLILVSTAPPMPEMVVPSGGTMRVLTKSPPKEREAAKAWLDEVWGSVAAPGFAQRGRQILREMVWDSAEAPTPRTTVALQSMAIMGFDRPERLESIGAPTLVVHGTEDPLMPPENGRRLAKLVPGATLEELDGVGHLVPWEAPERTAELVRAAFQVGSSW
ncbi:MAG: hypothetical protein QOG64_13 [Acidimicrobiaceae bacterium]|nr:hypothetical protein [Acidimicrobiaceae bacterium]